MKQVSIFPTWECQLSCDYCSIRNSKIDRTLQPVPWQLWAKALPRVLPPGSVVDIAGGEPLLYRGIVNLLHVLARSGLPWAITSNLKNTDVVERLYRSSGALRVHQHERPPGQPRSHANKRRLREAGYRVNVHRVNHPAAGTHEPDAQTITYQDWAGGKAVDGKRRYCTAGKDHWIANPAGDLWRCIVAAEVGQPPIGNLFTGVTEPVGPLCDFGCTTCYTENPGAWHVEMREREDHASANKPPVALRTELPLLPAAAHQDQPRGARAPLAGVDTSAHRPDAAGQPVRLWRR